MRQTVVVLIETHLSLSLFRVAHIPSDNHIRNILDPVPARQLGEQFWQLFAQMQANGLLATPRTQ